MLYDAFICHASEDKEAFVRPLADALASFHLEIWYDEFSLTVGDSLRQAIDKGLSKCRFGIVVLSPDFFKKGWAQRELSGLVAREISEERRLILPIWHNVTATDITRYSPTLADTFALNSIKGVNAVCDALIRKLRPDESPLIAARDELLRRGVEPPVISDEWWLNVVEASNRISNGGSYVPETSVWGAWSFPLPNENTFGAERGRFLAWTALQLEWCQFAEEKKICQITEPERVLEFIERFPGLSELCEKHPTHVACYAPQLTIPEFSGALANAFDSEMQASLKRANSTRLCDKEWCLRHPTFANYPPLTVAHQFAQGEMFAPKLGFFEPFEIVVWLLSAYSQWLPERIRSVLISGMATWAAWPIGMSSGEANADTVLAALMRARHPNKFRYSTAFCRALDGLIASALAKLCLKHDVAAIRDGLVEHRFAESYIEMKASRGKVRGKRAS